jgi:transcription-repair coupling factor (superfamily II helicase)
MLEFLEQKIDVLVSTTIIESGLDIPNANTIFIHNADQFGLADLHQLRGRVGRYKHQAYAYLLLPRDRTILPQARKRLKAIEEFSELGAGFKIALRDLEIRGVGNLLGREQHGHIAAVGYEYYCRLLERAVRKAQKKGVEEELGDPSVDLGGDAYVPESYIPDLSTRVDAYKAIARCTDEPALEDARRRLEDRFGRFPPEVERFLDTVRVKILARRHAFGSISAGDERVVVKFLDRQKALTLRRIKGDAVRLVDSETIHLAVPPDPRAIAALLRRDSLC